MIIPAGEPRTSSEVNHMWGGSTGYASHREVKSVCNTILQAEPGGSSKPAWASVPITFGYHDCPENLTFPGRLPLVVSPVIANNTMHKVLIDGGSSFGIITLSTLRKMQVPSTYVKPISNHFYGVIPGLAHKPVGQITLPVTFRNGENFRTEQCVFEVVDFPMVYNALLGRPQISQFMGIPNYTYMMFKLPGPRGVITIKASLKHAVECDRRSYEMRMAVVPDQELQEEHRTKRRAEDIEMEDLYL